MGHYNSETRAVRKKGHHKGHYENIPGKGSKAKREDHKKYPSLKKAVKAAKELSKTQRAPDQNPDLTNKMRGK